MDIVRARECLAGLADGVNPLTGELLPEDCVCNQPEIVRALYTALAALSPKAEKPLPANTGKPWTSVEEDKLLDEFDGGMKSSQIAKEHGRTRGAIEGRLVKLGKIDKAFRFPRT